MKFSAAGSWQWTDQRGSSGNDRAFDLEAPLEV